MTVTRESEHDKAGQLLQDLLKYLNAHPERHTPWMDRWAELIIEQGVCVYACKPDGAAAGRRLMYGTPARLVECIESCERFGKAGVWFCRVVTP